MLGFRVVVLTCGPLGTRVAHQIAALPHIERVLVVRSPYRQPKRGVRSKIRHVYRMEGPGGLLKVLKGKLLPRRMSPNGSPALISEPKLDQREVPDFHAPETLTLVRDFAADLGVIAGTYILKPAIFSLPRLGSINLHTGKVPEYRGAAPAFWEMFNGESTVGITIHQVEVAVDSGVVYCQENFPFDSAPAGDPLEYIQQYRRNVLLPNGIRMLTETVAAIATGSAAGVRQDTSRAHTYKSPDHRQVKELRRRVAARRQK